MPLSPSKLKSRRERLKLTQQQVAAAAGLQRSYYARLEGGIDPASGKPINPPLAIVERVAEALDCSILRIIEK